MKNKLIPKHQAGKKILNWLGKQFIKFGNAQIAGDSGVGTAMAIASGYLHNPKTGMWELSKENLKETEELRNNLGVLSIFTPTTSNGLKYGFGFSDFFKSPMGKKWLGESLKGMAWGTGSDIVSQATTGKTLTDHIYNAADKGLLQFLPSETYNLLSENVPDELKLTGAGLLNPMYYGPKAFSSLINGAYNRVSNDSNWIGSALAKIPTYFTSVNNKAIPDNLWGLKHFPGFLLKTFSQNSSEKLIKNGVISKQGYIDVNLLRAIMKNSSALEKEIVENVLLKHFTNLPKIDYNTFRKYIQKELVPYHKHPSSSYATYGFKHLGYDKSPGYMAWRPDRIAWPGIKFKTFTFTSSRIPNGNAKHYNKHTLGHVRTFTNKSEPNVLYVMENLSDWALDKLMHDLSKSSISKIHEKYLKDNFTQKQLNEILKFASNKGYYKMRYPTPKTAAAIEGYTKLSMYAIHDNPILQKEYDLLNKRIASEAFETPQGVRFDFQKNESNYKTNVQLTPDGGIKLLDTPDGVYMDELEEFDLLAKSLKDGFSTLDFTLVDPVTRKPLILEKPKKNTELLTNRLNQLKKLVTHKFDYPDKHKTILKKYEEFLKVYKKLFGKEPEIVKDSKGNTWYEIDVPNDFLNLEWLYRKGGSIHIKEKNKGKFTEYCNGKVTQECIDKAKKSGNKKLVKRAVFAENSRKWNIKK